MGFHNVTLDPKFLGYGSTGGAGHRTFIPDSPSGVETATALWSETRRRFTLSNDISLEDAIELFEFILARRGSSHSFLIKDPIDFTTASDHIAAPAWNDAVIGTGDGVLTEFQLFKYYEPGLTNELAKRIYKPVPGIVASGHGGSSKILNTDFTIDHQFGRISYVTAPASGDVTAGCEFRLQVRFGKSADDLLGLTYDGFRNASYSVDVVEDIGDGRVPAHSELTTYVGGLNFEQDVPTPYYLPFQFGRFVEYDNAAPLTVRLPDINTLVGGVSLFTSGLVTAGGPYFVIYNNGVNSITLEERFSAAWRTIGTGIGDSVIPIDTAREIYIDDLGIWRAR